MNNDLIVDFPHNQPNSRAVHFAKTAQLHIFEHQNVPRHELSYAKAEYAEMKLAVMHDVLAVRTSREDVGDDTVTNDNESLCLMGIEHLLTPLRRREVRACRARCMRAVLTEQARVRQDPSPRFDWGGIALASLAETRKATLRARKLGEFHQNPN